MSVNYFTELLRQHVAITRDEIVRGALTEGTFSQMICEAASPTIVVKLALDGYKVVLEGGFFHRHRLVGIFVAPCNMGVRTVADGELTRLRCIDWREMYADQYNLFNPSAHSKHAKSVPHGPETLIAELEREVSGTPSKIREITHFPNSETLSRVFSTAFIETYPSLQMVLAPVRYGDELMALVVAIANGADLCSDGELDGSKRNMMTVISDGFARALKIAGRAQLHG